MATEEIKENKPEEIKDQNIQNESDKVDQPVSSGSSTDKGTKDLYVPGQRRAPITEEELNRSMRTPTIDDSNQISQDVDNDLTNNFINAAKEGLSYKPDEEQGLKDLSEEELRLKKSAGQQIKAMSDDNDFIYNSLTGKLGDVINKSKDGNFNFTLKDKKYYWNNPSIRKVFEEQFGEDAEAEFDKKYKESVNGFYDVTLAGFYQKNITAGIEDTNGTMFTPESRSELFKLYNQDLSSTGGSVRLPDGTMSKKQFSIRQYQHGRVKLGGKYIEVEDYPIEEMLLNDAFANDEGKRIQAFAYSNDGIGMEAIYEGESSAGKRVASKWDLSGVTDIQLEGNMLSCIPRSVATFAVSTMTAGAEMIKGVVGGIKGEAAKKDGTYQYMNDLITASKTFSVSQADDTLEKGLASVEGITGLCTDVIVQLLTAKNIGAVLGRATGSANISKIATRTLLTMNGVADVGEAAEVNGLNPRETALLLGASFYGMWKVNSAFNYYEGIQDAKFVQKRMTKTIMEAAEKVPKIRSYMQAGGPKAEEKFFEKVAGKIMAIGDWGRNNIQVGGYVGGQAEGVGLAREALAKGGQEAMEEFSEYAVQEGIQHLHNLKRRIMNGKPSEVGKGSFKDITDKDYLPEFAKNAVLNALGGFVGGGIVGPMLDIKSFCAEAKERDPQSYESIVNAVASNNKEALFGALDKLKNAGKLGPTNVSYEWDNAEKRFKLTQEVGPDAVSMNDVMYREIKSEIESIHSAVEAVGGMGLGIRFATEFPELERAITSTSLMDDLNKNVLAYLDKFTNISDEDYAEVQAMVSDVPLTPEQEEALEEAKKSFTPEQMECYEIMQGFQDLHNGKTAERYIKQAITLAPENVFVEEQKKKMGEGTTFIQAMEAIHADDELLYNYNLKSQMGAAAKRVSKKYGNDFFDKLDRMYYNIDAKNKVKHEKTKEAAEEQEQLLSTLSPDMSNLKEVVSELFENNTLLQFTNYKVKDEAIQKIRDYVDNVDINTAKVNLEEYFKNIEYNANPELHLSEGFKSSILQNPYYGTITEEATDQALEEIMVPLYKEYYGGALNEAKTASDISNIQVLTPASISSIIPDSIDEVNVEANGEYYTLAEAVALNSREDLDEPIISPEVFAKYGKDLAEYLKRSTGEAKPLVGSGLVSEVDNQLSDIIALEDYKDLSDQLNNNIFELKDVDLALSPEDMLSHFESQGGNLVKKTGLEQQVKLIEDKNKDKGDIPSDYVDTDEVEDTIDNCLALVSYFEGLKTAPNLLYDFRKRFAQSMGEELNENQSLKGYTKDYTEMYFDPIEYGRLTALPAESLTASEQKYISKIKDILDHIELNQGKVYKLITRLKTVEADIQERIKEGVIADPFNPNLIKRTKSELAVYAELVDFLNDNEDFKPVIANDPDLTDLLNRHVGDSFDTSTDKIADGYADTLIRSKIALYNASEKSLLHDAITKFVNEAPEEEIKKLKKEEGHHKVLSNLLTSLYFNVQDFYDRTKALMDLAGSPTMDQQLAAQLVAAHMNTDVGRLMTVNTGDQAIVNQMLLLTGIAGSGKSTYSIGSGLKIGQDIQNSKLGKQGMTKVLLTGNTKDQSKRLIETAEKYDLDHKTAPMDWKMLKEELTLRKENFQDIGTIVIDEATFIPYNAASSDTSNNNDLLEIGQLIEDINADKKIKGEGTVPIKVVLMGDPDQGGFFNEASLVKQNVGAASANFASYTLKSSLRAYVEAIPAISNAFKSRTLNPASVAKVESVYGVAKTKNPKAPYTLGGVQFNTADNIGNDVELAKSLKALIADRKASNAADPDKELFSIAVISKDGIECLSKDSEVRKIIQQAEHEGTAKVVIKAHAQIQGDEVDYAIVHADPSFNVLNQAPSVDDLSNFKAKYKGRELATSITRARYLAAVINDADLPINPAELTTINVKDSAMNKTLIAGFSSTMQSILDKVVETPVEFGEINPNPEQEAEDIKEAVLPASESEAEKMERLQREFNEEMDAKEAEEKAEDSDGIISEEYDPDEEEQQLEQLGDDLTEQYAREAEARKEDMLRKEEEKPLEELKNKLEEKTKEFDDKIETARHDLDLAVRFQDNKEEAFLQDELSKMQKEFDDASEVIQNDIRAIEAKLAKDRLDRQTLKDQVKVDTAKEAKRKDFSEAEQLLKDLQNTIKGVKSNISEAKKSKASKQAINDLEFDLYNLESDEKALKSKIKGEKILWSNAEKKARREVIKTRRELAKAHEEADAKNQQLNLFESSDNSLDAREEYEAELKRLDRARKQFAIDFRNTNPAVSVEAGIKALGEATNTSDIKNAQSELMYKAIDNQRAKDVISQETLDHFSEMFINENPDNTATYMKDLDINKGKVACYTHNDEIKLPKDYPFSQDKRWRPFNLKSPSFMNAVMNVLGYGTKGNSKPDFSKVTNTYLVSHKEEGQIYANITCVTDNDVFILGSFPLNSIDEFSSMASVKETLNMRTPTDGTGYIVELNDPSRLFKTASKGPIKKIKGSNVKVQKVSEFIKNMKAKYGKNLQIGDTVYVNYGEEDAHRGESFLLYTFNKKVKITGREGESFFNSDPNMIKDPITDRWTLPKGVGIIYLNNTARPFSDLVNNFEGLTNDQLVKYQDYALGKNQQLAAIEAFEAVALSLDPDKLLTKFTNDKYSHVTLKLGKASGKTIDDGAVDSLVQELNQDLVNEGDAGLSAIATFNVLAECVGAGALGNTIKSKGVYKSQIRKVLSESSNMEGKVKYSVKVVPKLFPKKFPNADFNFPITYVQIDSEDKVSLEVDDAEGREDVNYNFNMANLIRLTEHVLETFGEDNDLNAQEKRNVRKKVLENINKVFLCHEAFQTKSGQNNGIMTSVPVVAEPESGSLYFAVNALPLPNMNTMLDQLTTTVDEIRMPVLYADVKANMNDNMNDMIKKGKIMEKKVSIPSMETEEKETVIKDIQTIEEVIEENKEEIFNAIKDIPLSDEEVKAIMKEEFLKIIEESNADEFDSELVDETYKSYKTWKNGVEPVHVQGLAPEEKVKSEILDAEAVDLSNIENAVQATLANQDFFSTFIKTAEKLGVKPDSEFYTDIIELGDNIKNILVAPSVLYVDNYEDDKVILDYIEATNDIEKRFLEYSKSLTETAKDKRKADILLDPKGEAEKALMHNLETKKEEGEIPLDMVLSSEGDMTTLRYYYDAYDLNNPDTQKKKDAKDFILRQFGVLTSPTFDKDTVNSQVTNLLESENLVSDLAYLVGMAKWPQINLKANQDLIKLISSISKMQDSVALLQAKREWEKVPNKADVSNSELKTIQETVYQLATKFYENQKEKMEADPYKYATERMNSEDTSKAKTIEDLDPKKFDKLLLDSVKNPDKAVKTYKEYNLNESFTPSAVQMKEAILSALGVPYELSQIDQPKAILKQIGNIDLELTPQQTLDANALNLTWGNARTLSEHIFHLFNAKTVQQAARKGTFNSQEEVDAMKANLQLTINNVQNEWDTLPNVLKGIHAINRSYNARIANLTTMIDKLEVTVPEGTGELGNVAKLQGHGVLSEATIKGLETATAEIDPQVFDLQQFTETLDQIEQENSSEVYNDRILGKSMRSLIQFPFYFTNAGMTYEQVEELQNYLEEIVNNKDNSDCKN